MEPGELGLEAFGTASGLAVIAGSLAVVVPMFDALTVTLVALAIAGWASARRRGARRAGVAVRAVVASAVGLVALGIAGAAYVAPPAPLAPWRALVLALGVVPLWTLERRRAERRPAGLP